MTELERLARMAWRARQVAYGFPADEPSMGSKGWDVALATTVAVLRELETVKPQMRDALAAITRDVPR